MIRPVPEEPEGGPAGGATPELPASGDRWALGGPDARGSRLGAYALRREIGRGAAGVVYEAEGADGRAVALKLLAPPVLLAPEEAAALRARFLREARALAAVDHPNVVRIFDVGEAEGRFYLAMELLRGENLRRLLARDGPFPVARVVELGRQLCSALEAIHHAGIVHRDIKPENLVLLPDGTLKLTDFGIAWIEGEATLTRTGGVLGSPAYMSPEQILARPVDRRTDLFSAAVTLYQLLSDRLPFAGEGLVQLAHSVAYEEPAPLPAAVPPALARALLRGLQKSPAARYATAAEFAEALRLAVPRAEPARPTPRRPAMLSRGPAVPAAVEATRVDPAARCARHPGRPAVGHCLACGRAVCRACARSDAPPFYCLLHQPVLLFGISTVRLEVALAAALFLLLLLCLSPIGYAAFSR